MPTLQELEAKLAKVKNNTLLPKATKEAAIKKIEADIDEMKPKKEKKAPVKVAKKAPDYDCDDIIAKEKERRAKKKKIDKTPTNKRDEKAVKKVVDRVKKHYKQGELSKSQIQSLIKEFTDKLNELKELLKSAK